MKIILMLIVGLMLAGCGSTETMFVIVMRWIVIVIWWAVLRWTRYALALDD